MFVAAMQSDSEWEPCLNFLRCPPQGMQTLSAVLRGLLRQELDAARWSKGGDDHTIVPGTCSIMWKLAIDSDQFMNNDQTIRVTSFCCNCNATYACWPHSKSRLMEFLSICWVFGFQGHPMGAIPHSYIRLSLALPPRWRLLGSRDPRAFDLP